MQNAQSLRPLQSQLLEDNSASRIRHGFFTREGGVSNGIYQGLNVGLGSDDDREAVLENRARVAGWFGLEAARLATVHQVHSPNAVTVNGTFSDDRPHADAMVTATPGVVLGVLSADCGPVLFSDAQAGVIGAAHAGWKGALGGVLENTIAAMEALGASRERIVACLGPSIGRNSYEVGPEFVTRFLSFDPGYEQWFRPSEKPDHAMFDLPGLTMQRLAAAGIRAENLDICTYPDAGRFYSYRRTTHAGEPDYGRQISAIAITENSA